MHTSDTLSRLHNFTDTPDQKDVIPLNFLQHLTPHYIRKLPYKEFVIFNLKLKDHQLQVNSFIKSNFP